MRCSMMFLTAVSLMFLIKYFHLFGLMGIPFTVGFDPAINLLSFTVEKKASLAVPAL